MSLWFRRSYERVPQMDTNVGTGTLGWVGSSPLHVVVADNIAEDEVIVITTYQPEPALWSDGFRRRRDA